jgi:hypothetical protein
MEITNQWYYRPDYMAIMSDCANTQIGLVGEQPGPQRRGGGVRNPVLIRAPRSPRPALVRQPPIQPAGTALREPQTDAADYWLHRAVELPHTVASASQLLVFSVDRHHLLTPSQQCSLLIVKILRLGQG